MANPVVAGQPPQAQGLPTATPQVYGQQPQQAQAQQQQPQQWYPQPQTSTQAVQADGSQVAAGVAAQGTRRAGTDALYTDFDPTLLGEGPTQTATGRYSYSTM